MEKKVMVGRPPKGIEGRTIQLEFVGNIDIAVENMKWNNFCELDNSQILQLKCCLLFLCGMSFSKIAEQLNISKATISKYLNDNLLEGLLSFEYKVLFRLNRSRLQPENKNSKVKRAVETFIEQNGNYHKTAEITGFSDRTLSRYFSDPKLQEILENEQLYQRFIDVKNSHISEIKRDAANSNVQLQSIKSHLSLLQPNGIVEKRYLVLCTALLIEQISDLEGLMTYTKMSKTNIESYLLDTSRCLGFLPDNILELFKQKALQITTGNDDNFLLEEYEKSIIEVYMSGRYSYEDVSEIVGIRNTRLIDNIIREKSRKLLSVEEVVALEKHKSEVVPLLQVPTTNKCLIKDGKMISIVKPNIIFVNPSEFRLLSALVQFLTIYESIKYSNIQEVLVPTEIHLLSNMNHLKELLTEEAFANLNTILDIERLLYGNELQNKYQYIISVVREFFSKNLDLEATSTYLGIPVESLIRVLQSDFVESNYGAIISEYVKQAIQNYQTYNTQEKKEKIYVYR